MDDSRIGETDDRGVNRMKDDDLADVDVVRELVPDKNSSSNSESRLKIDRELSEATGEFGRGGS